MMNEIVGALAITATVLAFVGAALGIKLMFTDDLENNALRACNKGLFEENERLRKKLIEKDRELRIAEEALDLGIEINFI